MSVEETPDPETLLDDLVDGGVLDLDPETEDVTLTEDFDATLQIFEETYGPVTAEEFHSTVAEVFGLEDAAAAAERIDDHDVTREQLAAFLALRSHLEDPPDIEQLAVMATMITDVGLGSPVPAMLDELGDESFQSYLDGHDHVVVTVWRHHCDPCDGLKRRLDEIIAAAPDGVDFAGIDGETAIDFRKAFDIEAAPTTLFFRDGEVVERIRGRSPVQQYADILASLYG